MKNILISAVSRLLILSILLPQCLIHAADSVARTALLIGNAKYVHAPLDNPANDAEDLAKLLKEMGFDVSLLIDGDLVAMERAVNDFGRKLEQNGGVGLFFYAGHGIQSKGRNYLIPVKVDLERETDLKYKTLDAGKIIDEMGYANNGLNIVILDACRDNPLVRSFGRGMARGLARMTDTPTGMLIAYSTAPGTQAADGNGRNSPYTESLLKAIPQPGKPLEMVFKDVIKNVKNETSGKQIPWTSSSVHGDFYFIEPDQIEKTQSGPENQTSAIAVSSPPQQQSDEKFELLYWQGIINKPSPDLYRAYLKKYPDGHFVEIAESHLQQLKKRSAEQSEVNHDEQKHLTKELENCRNFLDNYFLTTGPNGDAYSCYKEVLKAHPDNQQAKKGLVKVTDAYVRLIKKHLKNKSLKYANKYLNILESLDREHPQLADLSKIYQHHKQSQLISKTASASKQINIQDSGKGYNETEKHHIYHEYEDIVVELLAIKNFNDLQAKKTQFYLNKMQKLGINGQKTQEYQQAFNNRSKIKLVSKTRVIKRTSPGVVSTAAQTITNEENSQVFNELYLMTDQLVNSQRLSYKDHKKIKIYFKKLYAINPESKKLEQLKEIYEEKSKRSIF